MKYNNENKITKKITTKQNNVKKHNSEQITFIWDFINYIRI